MARVLFVSNGHGEAAIADRIAQELHALHPGVEVDHLALVGEHSTQAMREVGPRQTMPSGGLIAMGQVKNITRDLRAGLVGLTLAQRAFLARSRGDYDLAVAVGDVFALLMALAARVQTSFVGTAKSVRVAPYGAMERRVLRRARDVFVRDDATAQRLRAQGVDASAPGNVIVDLFAAPDDPHADLAARDFVPAIAVLPGSRASAYGDARFLLDVVRRAARERPSLGALLSVAPMLDPLEYERVLRDDGWEIVSRQDPRVPFVARSDGRDIVRAWRGPLGPLLSRVQVVIGQAGTANEAAASAGIPVMAFELGNDRKTAWYRMRQVGLLGDALAIAPGEPDLAARELGALLDDAPRRVAMGAAGRANMGPPGGALAIARALAARIA